MNDAFILSIDQGTTGTTVLVVNLGGNEGVTVLGQATVNFPQHFPKADWVEHDLNEIWQSLVQAAKQACGQAEAKSLKFSRKMISAVGITNQRETLCIYERSTLKPLMPAIVWQCKRSSELCQKIKAEGLETEIRQKTGLFVDPYFTGTKIKWVMENHPDIATKIKSGSAILGTIDTFLISRLSQGQAHVTEASNASRTLLFDIRKGCWDEDLLSMMGLSSASALADIKDSAGVFALTKGLDFLPDGIPISGVLGDQQAALAGQRCFAVGEAKCTYGTGAFLLLNIGNQVLASHHGLLTTVAWQLASKRTFAIEGSAFIAGAALQFLQDNLGILSDAQQSEALARGSQAAPEIYFVPALAGLGAPWWQPKVRGAFLGLTRATTSGQLARATLEGIAFQVCDLIDSMRQDYGHNLRFLRVDGGAASNSLLLQIQADLTGLVVERPYNLESTSLGAALFAGLGLGYFRQLEDLKAASAIHSSFEPSKTQESKNLTLKQRKGWQRAVRAIDLFSRED